MTFQLHCCVAVWSSSKLVQWNVIVLYLFCVRASFHVPVKSLHLSRYFWWFFLLTIIYQVLMFWSKCCSNEMDELSWSLHHDYGNMNREIDNLWGLRRTDMMITAEWDRWGETFVKQNEARDRRETHSMSAMCESLERKGEVWGKWSVVAAVTSEKTKKRFSCYQVKDWRKHLPSLRCDYLEMRYLLRVLNVLIILWNVLNGAPVNFVELNEDGSPKTSVTTSADSISEISLRIF